MITNQTTDFASLDYSAGQSILIDKPLKFTSFKVIHLIRKAINVKRVGHTGTLDPLATGLLIILTGKNTKKMNEFLDLDKSYSGTILLGKSSPSMDTETEMESREIHSHLSDDVILKTRDNFLGSISQLPPMYSALKVKGKKLYELARKGKTVKREPRIVNISRFEITRIDLPEIHFEVDCSKGTYIRVLANDFGEALGCGGVISSLRRTAIGNYKIENALKLEDFIQNISSLSKDKH
ncbi:tRNA pseudouridine(55) synthase TruB [bacterium BMS3Abin03]|jgi:tRNA pseudouridine55 synthase|nr:tRNA pseudouridine(55) synthase TruB [bacterium BMS3Abin03]MCG6960864.1 tRNA pseudouridine(55) synthase TruB [bacterium BMS3Abin03]